MTEACPHEEFRTDVAINRLTAIEGGPVTNLSADIRIHCVRCGEHFIFLGCSPGLSSSRPMVSVDGEELRAPIAPASNPEAFGETMASFAVRARIARDGHDA